MTIQTNVAVGTVASLEQPSKAILAATALLGTFGLLLTRRRLPRPMVHLVAFVTLGSALMGMTSCSSGSFGQKSVLTTPPGTYTIQVVAKQAGSLQVPAPGKPGVTVTVVGSGNQVSVPYAVTLTVK